MNTKRYIVRYTTNSLAHIESIKMERVVQVLIGILFVVYWIKG